MFTKILFLALFFQAPTLPPLHPPIEPDTIFIPLNEDIPKEVTQTQEQSMVIIQATMPMLMESASLHGIEVYLSDELGALGINRHLYKNASVQTFDVDDRVFRLSPDSSCSRGKENLKESSVVPLWDRKTQPHLFLEAIFQESKQPIEKRNKFIRRFLSNFIAT